MLGDYGYERAFTEPEVHAVAIAVIARRSRIVGVDGHGVRAADEDVLAGLLEADVPIVASLLVESYLRAVLAKVARADGGALIAGAYWRRRCSCCLHCIVCILFRRLGQSVLWAQCTITPVIVSREDRRL